MQPCRWKKIAERKAEGGEAEWFTDRQVIGDERWIYVTFVIVEKCPGEQATPVIS